MNYSIGDLIIRVKNGYLAHKESISTPHSRFREDVLKKLKGLGYIKDYKVKGDKVKTIDVKLAYHDGVSAMTGIKLYSSPGRRWYRSAKDIKPVLGGLGVAIVSTSKGILTNKETKKSKAGGELLFEIW